MAELGIAGLGFAVGLLIGLTGMGGGSLMTPLLILVLGVRPVVAVGTDLVYAAATKLVGAWQHSRQGTVDRGLALRLAMGSVPGALLGVLATTVAHQRLGADVVDGYLLRAIGLMLVLTAVAMLRRCLAGPGPGSVGEPPGRHHPTLVVAAGAAVGFLVGLTSVGSGSIIAALLVTYYRLPAARLVGTDVFHAALLVLGAGLAHLGSGNVDLPMAANLLLGSVPGVLVGSRLSRQVPERLLRPTLGVMLLASGLRML